MSIPFKGPPMTTSQRILVTAFKALTAREKDRLRWHLEKGTPVLCGKNAALFVDGFGGA